MLDIDVPDGFVFSETLKDALDRIAGLLKFRLPGAFLIARHIVVGVISGDDHERLENDLLVPALLHQREKILESGRGFHGPDVVILEALVREKLLHLCIDLVGLGFRAVAHEADRRLSVIIRGCRVGDRSCDRVKIRVVREERSGDFKMFEGIRILCDLVDEIRIFKAVHHEVGRLHDERLYIVGDGPVERFLYIVDLHLVAGFDMIDDDLAGKCAADAVFRKCLRKLLLDRADRESPAVIVACSEADDKKLLLADLIRVQWIVERCVSCVIILLIRFRCSALRAAFNCGFTVCFALCCGFAFRLAFRRSARCGRLFGGGSVLGGWGSGASASGEEPRCHSEDGKHCK